MKMTRGIVVLLAVILSGQLLLSSFRDGTSGASGEEVSRPHFPYRKSGLTGRQAAAHLLSRFTYGATPGEVDAVVREGLENWFVQQLKAGLPDDSLNARLRQYEALGLSNEQVETQYPRRGQVLRMAVRDGIIDKDSVKTDRAAYREVIRSYMFQKGYKPEQDLFRQFISQKILRAAYSNNQLLEVMTDFWFNHFNVSLSKNDCAEFIPAYERDVIRPNALGKFDSLLLKTAKSPAMLYYLDNFNSSGVKGLNENYAREVMELHTLGVDGGYTQQDVTEAARVLTGWTVYPMNEVGRAAINRFTPQQLDRRGFVHEGDFLFNANRHDKGQKTVLGHVFPAGGGYEEGVELLEMLAHSGSTARFISRKIAVRFVSDDPPQSLIDKMARTFSDKDGDIRQVLLTMVEAPEFWSPAAVRGKTKSPFELAIGAVRSLHADIGQPYPLYVWISRMGEKKYYYQAPTGFPDKGIYWINTGSLLNRMNFGLALAAGRVPGVSVDLGALTQGHEPESEQAALVTYGHLILPERDLDGTIRRLAPLLGEEGLTQKIAAANGDGKGGGEGRQGNGTANGEGRLGNGTANGDGKVDGEGRQGDEAAEVAQVVGIIIGSPEYQRR
jgi:uncharacterized protein (DUF1800 family)